MRRKVKNKTRLNVINQNFHACLIWFLNFHDFFCEMKFFKLMKKNLKNFGWFFKIFLTEEVKENFQCQTQTFLLCLSHWQIKLFNKYDFFSVFCWHLRVINSSTHLDAQQRSIFESRTWSIIHENHNWTVITLMVDFWMCLFYFGWNDRKLRKI